MSTPRASNVSTNVTESVQREDRNSTNTLPIEPKAPKWCGCFKQEEAPGQVSSKNSSFTIHLKRAGMSSSKSDYYDLFPLLTQNFYSTSIKKENIEKKSEQKKEKDKLVDLSDAFCFCSHGQRCGFGKSYLVTLWQPNHKNEVMLLKILKKTSDLAFFSIRTETSCLKKLQGTPFFRKVLATFQTKIGFCMLTEFRERMSIAQLVEHKQGLGKEAIVFYSSEVICALSSLHETGVIHRSLSAENVLIDLEGHIIVSDLGFASFLNKTDLTLFDGPPYFYLAPEMVKGELYTKDVDWWALGVLIYFCLYNRVPFSPHSGDHLDVLFKIIHTFPTFVDHPGNEQIIELCRMLLVKRQRHRLGFGPSDAEKVKEHSCFQDVDWTKTSARSAVPPPFPDDAPFFYTAVRTIVTSKTRLFTAASDKDLSSAGFDEEIVPVSPTRSIDSFGRQVRLLQSLRELPAGPQPLDVEDTKQRLTIWENRNGSILTTKSSVRTERLDSLKQELTEAKKSSLQDRDLSSRTKSQERILNKSNMDLPPTRRSDFSESNNSSNMFVSPTCNGWSDILSKIQPAGSASESELIMTKKTHNVPPFKNMNMSNLSVISDSNLSTQILPNYDLEFRGEASLKSSERSTDSLHSCLQRVTREMNSTTFAAVENFNDIYKNESCLQGRKCQKDARYLTRERIRTVSKSVNKHPPIEKNMIEMLREKNLTDKRAHEVVHNNDSDIYEGFGKIFCSSEIFLDDTGNTCDESTNALCESSMDDCDSACVMNSNNCNYFDICPKNRGNVNCKNENVVRTIFLNKDEQSVSRVRLKPFKNHGSKFQSRLLTKNIRVHFYKQRVSSAHKSFVAKLKNRMRGAGGLFKLFSFKTVDNNAKESQSETPCSKEKECSLDLKCENTFKTVDTYLLKSSSPESKHPDPNANNKQNQFDDPGEIVLPSKFLELIVKKTFRQTLKSPPQQLCSEDNYRQFCGQMETKIDMEKQETPFFTANQLVSSIAPTPDCGLDLVNHHSQETTFPASPLGSPLTSYKYYKTVWRRSRLVSKDTQSILYWATDAVDEEHDGSLRGFKGVGNMFCRWREIIIRNQKRRKTALVPAYFYRMYPLVTRTQSFVSRGNVAYSVHAQDKSALSPKETGTAAPLNVLCTKTEAEHNDNDQNETPETIETQEASKISTTLHDRMCQYDTQVTNEKESATIECVLTARKLHDSYFEPTKNTIQGNLNESIFREIEAQQQTRELHKSENHITRVQVANPLESRCYWSCGRYNTQIKRALSHPASLTERQFNLSSKDLKTLTKNIIPSDKTDIKTKRQTQLPAFSQGCPHNSIENKNTFYLIQRSPLLPRKSKSFESHRSAYAFHKAFFIAYSTDDIATNFSREQYFLTGRSHSDNYLSTPPSSSKEETVQSTTKFQNNLTITLIKSTQNAEEPPKESHTTPLCSSFGPTKKEKIPNVYQGSGAAQTLSIESEGIQVDETLEELRARYERALRAKEKLMADADTITLWDTWQCPPNTNRFCGDGNGIRDMTNLSFNLQSQMSRTFREPNVTGPGQIVGTLTIEYTNPPMEGLIVLQ